MASAGDLDRGSSFEYKGEILRVQRKEVVAVGTHSHTKLKFFVRPLFTSGGEKTVTFGHNDKVDIVEAQRKAATIVSKLPDKVQIMDSHSYEMYDADIEDELKDRVKEGDAVIFVEYKGKVMVIDTIAPRQEK